MTVGDFFKETAAKLAAALGSNAEGEAAARILFEDLAGYDRKYLFMHSDREILDFTQQKILKAVQAVVAGMPVQYAVGKARFMGMDFTVTPDVLIPRPETEGLCDMIIADAGGRTDLAVLDIGTGSGCIAIALARGLAFADVEAVDVSAPALEVAKANAKDLGAKVRFSQCDILAATPPASPAYDIIVSNPPYVLDSERAEMDRRVANEEPATALFVPDSDPLRFYRAITRYAAKALRPGGRLYFEINSRFPEETRALLAAEGFVQIDILRDYKGNYRFARASKPATQ